MLKSIYRLVVGPSRAAGGAAILPLRMVQFLYRLIPLAVLIGVIVGGYWLVGMFWSRGHVTPFDDRTAPVAARAAKQFASEIPPYKETQLNPVVVFPFTGPKGHILADMIRDAVDAAGLYNVVGKDEVESTLRKFNFEGPPVSESDARNAAAGNNPKAAAFVTGDILELDSRPDAPVLVFRAVFAATEGDFRWEFNFPSPTSTTAPAAGAFVDDPPPAAGWGFWGFLGLVGAFLALCAATPVLLYPLTRNLLARDSNLANFLMLLAYAAADTLALHRVIHGPRGIWGVFIIAVSFVVALWLNFLVCSRLENRRTQS